MNQWQPIETAPKDGTRIDLFGFWADKRPLRYMGGLGKKIERRAPGRRLTDYFWCSTHKCFRSHENLHYVDTSPKDVVVSHWMPIPEPPQ